MNKKTNAKTNAKKKHSKTASKKANRSGQSVDRMKYEIANEFGVSLGSNTSAYNNGRVGGEMTKRLIANGKSKSKSKRSSQSN